MNAECWLNISLTHPFLSQKHTKEVGRPQTPLKETTLEPWTQPQVGWNDFSDHFFFLVVVSVSIHGNNLKKKKLQQVALWFFYHISKLFVLFFGCPGYWLWSWSVSLSRSLSFFSEQEIPAFSCPQLELHMCLKKYWKISTITLQNRSTLGVSLVCQWTVSIWCRNEVVDVCVFEREVWEINLFLHEASTKNEAKEHGY